MRKRLIIVAAALAALPILLLVVAAVALPSDAVARRVAERAEAALGREVSIGDVGVSFLPLGVSLDEVAVAGPTSDAAPVVAVGEFLLRPRLLPLLRGRVVVDELRLVRPQITIVIDSAGVSNLPTLASDSSAEPTSTSLAFDVRDIRIEDGIVTLDDARTGRALRLDGVDESLRLSGDVRDGRLALLGLTGTLAIDSIAVRLPGDDDWTSRGIRVAVDHDARFQADSGALHLDSLRVQVQQVVLHGGGSVRGLTANDSIRMVDLRLAAEPFDVAQLIASLPARFTAKLRDEQAQLGGTAALAATVRGALGVDTFPAIDGVLRLRDVSAARAGQSLVASLDGDVAFANDSVATSALAGSALGEPFRLAFALHQPADPIVRFDLDGAVRLQALKDAGLLPDSVAAMQGRVHTALAGTLQRSSPATSRVDGRVTIERFATTTAKGQTVGLESAILAIAGDSMRLAPALVTIAGQSLTIGATVTDWMTRAFGDSTHLPSASFDVRGRRIDLEPVLGPAPSPTFSQLVFARLANSPVDGRTAEVIATERGAAPPELPPVIARGTIAIDTVLNAGVAYTDVRASIVSTPERLHVEEATFGMMGGRGDVTAVLTPRVAADGTGAMHVLVQADMQDLASDQFLTRFTSFRERANGRLDLTGVVELMMDAHMLPDRETVQGRGVMTLRDGRLTGWPVLRTLGERLGTAAFDTLRLREFTGGFDVAGPMIRLDDALLASSAGNARVAGSFTFDGRLDLGADARLPASLAARGGSALAGAIAAAADTTGEVPVGVRVAGEWRSPDVTPDLSQARANVVGAARAAATRQAERLAEESARALADRLGLGQAGADSAGDSTSAAPRLPSADSIGAAVDSARNAAENRVRDRLRSLF